MLKYVGSSFYCVRLIPRCNYDSIFTTLASCSHLHCFSLHVIRTTWFFITKFLVVVTCMYTSPSATLSFTCVQWGTRFSRRPLPAGYITRLYVKNFGLTHFLHAPPLNLSYILILYYYYIIFNIIVNIYYYILLYISTVYYIFRLVSYIYP